MARAVPMEYRPGFYAAALLRSDFSNYDKKCGLLDTTCDILHLAA